jgi:hypothetical protein
MPKIEITLRKGKVDVVGSGFKGEACVNPLTILGKALGKITSMKPNAELFEYEDDVAIKQQVLKEE